MFSFGLRNQLSKRRGAIQAHSYIPHVFFFAGQVEIGSLREPRPFDRAR